MKQVLSQEEIDSLLSAITSGEVPSDSDLLSQEANRAKPYDFKRPVKLSREYVDTLHMIFENYSKLSGMSISNQIISNVEMKVKAIEQISFEEFLRSVSSSIVMGVFKSDPLPSNQVIAISPHLSTIMIEKMCGGLSVKNVVFNEDKENSFTDIELSILEEVILGLLKTFEISWNEITPITTQLETIGSIPQVLQVMAPNEPVVLITFSVEIDGVSNFINICIPYLSFDNITDRLSFKSRFKHNHNTIDNSKSLIEKHLMGVPLDIEVSLGKSIITVEDVLDLDVGDVIELDMNIEQPLSMFIENLQYYYVKPGQIDDQMAVEVIEYISEGEDT